MAAGGIEEFDEARNLARVGAGFKGGTFFSNPNVAPAMTVSDGWPVEVGEKLMAGKIDQPPVQDPWVVRYPNSKMG